MKTSAKIRGVLAMAGVTQLELAQLSGVTRQTIHNYLNVQDIEDYARGLKVMAVVDKIMRLCVTDTLPLPTSMTDRMGVLTQLLASDEN